MFVLCAVSFVKRDFCSSFYFYPLILLAKKSRASAFSALLLGPLGSMSAALLWRQRRRILAALALVCAVYFFASFVYALPGYTVKRMLGA